MPTKSYQTRNKWYDRVGREKKNSVTSTNPQLSYQVYAKLQEIYRQKTPSLRAQFNQINKDVDAGRSDCGTLLPEVGEHRRKVLTAKFGSRKYEEEGRAQLTRVLMAYVVRNPTPGYVQGMNYICAFMLSFMDEEKTFWTFCALIEDLRLRDFYSHAMTGLQVTVELMCELIAVALPDVSALFPDYDGFQLFTQLLVSKLFIGCFVNYTNLSTNILIWDQLFAGKRVAGSGETFLVYALLGRYT